MPRADGQSGYALIAVLWLISLLAIMSASYHSTARREAQVLAQSVYETQARARAEAGIWIAVGEAIRAGRYDIPSRDSKTFTFDDEQIEVSLAEETGRVNLNRAGERALDLLLGGAGVGEGEREALVDAILDWRDRDDERRPSGAEGPEYAARGHGANDALFATVDELRHVRGMTDAVFRRIEGALTVYGDHARVSAEAADSEVLLSLSDNDEPTVEAFLREREAAGTEETPRLENMRNSLVRRVRGDVYTVRGRASAGDVETVVEATLQIPRRGNAPVNVLAWE